MVFRETIQMAVNRLSSQKPNLSPKGTRSLNIIFPFQVFLERTDNLTSRKEKEMFASAREALNFLL